MLPKLRPNDYGKKVLKYKLNDAEEKRHKAINSGIKASSKIYGSQRTAAIKKGITKKIYADIKCPRRLH